jgi:hypothetical protein
MQGTVLAVAPTGAASTPASVPHRTEGTLPSITLTITDLQRAALYRQVIQNLSGIGDINLLYEAGNYADAAALASRYVEDLRLLEDLSWPPSEDCDAFHLTMAPPELWLVLHRMRDVAQKGLRGDEEQRASRQATRIQGNYESTAKVPASCSMLSR